jgi:hypothetical protein
VTELGRHLDWPACWNIRDLGGLATRDGRRTVYGGVVRADGVDRLTVEGWSALWEYGVRTVVDLREEGERCPDDAPRPAGLRTVHVPLDDKDDVELWAQIGPLDGSPLYYRPFLDRKADRCAAAVSAVAAAGPGAVLVHCGAGRDRTGLVSLMLLAVAGVNPEEIVADYDLSTDRLQPAWAALGYRDQGPIIERMLAGAGTTAREVLLGILSDIDPAAYLRAGGATDDDLARVRARLLPGRCAGGQA